MATPPTRRAILGLYSTMLCTSPSFSSYNFREYFVRRTKDTLPVMQAETDVVKVFTQTQSLSLPRFDEALS